MSGADKVDINAINAAPKEPKTAEQPDFGVDPLTGRNGKLGMHLGWVGRFIGGGPEKAGNIAFFVICASVVLLLIGGGGLAYYGTDKVAEAFSTLVTGCISLITGALGYIFGKGSKDSE